MAKTTDFEIGTKFKVELYGRDSYNRKSFVNVTLIAYSKQGDQVAVLEDDNGKVYIENINDIYPIDKHDPEPLDSFTSDLLYGLQEGIKNWGNGFTYECSVNYDNTITAMSNYSGDTFHITVTHVKG